jgi:hypothetical protein
MVRMKTYACLNCGRRLESAEFAHANLRWSVGCRCPLCGTVVSLAGETLIVLGILWPIVLCPFLLWLLIEDRSGLPENVGCLLIIALGITRVIERRRAVLRRKCELDGAANAGCAASLTFALGLRTMEIRRHIASLLPTGGLVLLLWLTPGSWAADDAGRPQSTASFADVIERQLPAPSYIVEKQVLLNLDDGELLSMPTNVWMAGVSFSPRPRYNWMVKHGADLLVHSSEVSANLTFHLDDGRLAVLGTNLTFETIAASDVNELARRGVFQHLEILRPEKGPGATLVFQTREGGLGVMQLLAFSAKPEPILRLRCKLVRH